MITMMITTTKMMTTTAAAAPPRTAALIPVLFSGFLDGGTIDSERENY